MSTLRQASQQALELLDEARGELIDEEMWEFRERIDAAITALRAALAEPEQGPVFWFRPRSDWEYAAPIHNDRLDAVQKTSGGWVPLYTAPTPRNEPVIDKTMAKRIATQLGWEPPKKPLTEQEIQNIWAKTFEMGSSANTFARAIERAHGIKEQEHE